MAEHQVGVREFRDRMSTYIAHATAGETVTIMSRGKPVAQVVSPATAENWERKFGTMKGEIWMADDWDSWDEEELASFERDPCDIS